MDDAGFDGVTAMLSVHHTTQIFNHNQFLIPNF